MELKTCPSCGNDHIWIEDIDVWGATEFYAVCTSCGMKGGNRKTPAQAAEAWNTRAERTCAISDMDTGNVADYECREHIKHCKSCHHHFGYVLYNEDGDVWMNEQPRYCPNCGERVTDNGTSDN